MDNVFPSAYWSEIVLFLILVYRHVTSRKDWHSFFTVWSIWWLSNKDYSQYHHTSPLLHNAKHVVTLPFPRCWQHLKLIFLASAARYLNITFLISLIRAFTKQLKISGFFLLSGEGFTVMINKRCYSKALKYSNSIFSFLKLPDIHSIAIFTTQSLLLVLLIFIL